MKRTIIVALSLILVLLAFTSCEEEVHVHTWDEGTVTKAATCAEKGVKTFTCTACKETKVDEIPALGHDIKVVTVNPGYLTKGLKTSTCMREGCDFQEEEELEVESLAGKWMRTSIPHGGVVNLAFSNEGGRTNKMYVEFSPFFYTVDSKEEECIFVHDTGMDFEYSITNEAESTKIIITNNTGDEKEPEYTQRVPISEDLNSGTITIKKLNLGGMLIEEAVFSIVPAHDFTISDEPEILVYDEYTHVGGRICTEEIKEDEFRFVLGDYYKSGSHTYKNGSCTVCGYKN